MPIKKKKTAWQLSYTWFCIFIDENTTTFDAIGISFARVRYGHFKGNFGGKSLSLVFEFSLPIHHEGQDYTNEVTPYINRVVLLRNSGYFPWIDVYVPVWRLKVA
jgi:hypothetical protein